VLQRIKVHVIITVIIQCNLDMVKNIDRLCQFEYEHTLCIQLILIFSFFLSSLKSITLSCSAANRSVKPIAADALAT